jgi:hypothetical protein
VGEICAFRVSRTRNGWRWYKRWRGDRDPSGRAAAAFEEIEVRIEHDPFDARVLRRTVAAGGEHPMQAIGTLDVAGERVLPRIDIDGDAVAHEPLRQLVCVPTNAGVANGIDERDRTKSGHGIPRAQPACRESGDYSLERRL